ncbi:MAG: PhnD/SsuA/transferrin family substrate-binding protein [Rhizobiaceae bacterium]|jgi:phosphonate transport system substrate-binding protein|nr:PhnD/SsuA/transferrin family substrate-binding protein [Rhizobiaceae bacterium]
MINRRTLLAAGAALAVLAATPSLAADTIRLAITDVDGLENLQREFGPFKDAFEKISGLTLEFFPVSGRTAAVEAMAAKQVDFVLTGPAEYVVFRSRTNARPVVTWQRPDYFSYLIALEGSGVTTLADLKGKKVSFHEIGSTSRHLGPGKLLADAGLKFNTDFEAVYIKTNVGVEALQRGDLAALGVNHTDLARFRENLPEFKFVELAKSAQLPDDVLIAAPDVSEEIFVKVRDAFTTGSDELWAAVISTDANRKYVGGKFLPGVADSDYDVIRDMYRAVGIESFNEFAGG